MIMAKKRLDNSGIEATIEGSPNDIVEEISVIVLGVVRNHKEGVSPKEALEGVITSVYKICMNNLSTKSSPIPTEDMQQ